MSNTRKPKNIKDRLASAKLAEKTVRVCLRGDLAAEHETLEEQIKAALESERNTEGTTRRVGQKPESVRLAERQEKVRAQMADEMLTLTVRALPRHRWQEIAANHPPREDHDGDRALGVNLQPFAAEVMPLCIVDPELDDEDWARLNDVLSSGDYDRIFDAVWTVNRSGVDLPKSLTGSRVMRAYSAASKSPEPGE